MNKICGIYKITSPSGKIYIGQSVNIERRIAKYKYCECKQQPKIYHSIMKYGWNAHIFEVIHISDSENLNDLEKYYIRLYDSFNTEHGMNLTDGGEGANVTNETKEKIRKSKLGVKRSTTFRKKLSALKKGIQPHANCVHHSSRYKIFNHNNDLMYEFECNVKTKLKELKLPIGSFCQTFRKNTKINKGIYKDWYVVKL